LAKANVVSQDEREGGIRAILKFGPYFWPMQLNGNGVREIGLHGEAVACGAVCWRFDLSWRMGNLTEHDVSRSVALFQSGQFYRYCRLKNMTGLIALSSAWRWIKKY